MERIKNIDEVILRPDAVLAEVIEIKSSGLILPGVEKSADSLDYMVIVAKGSKVEDYEIGDYILDMPHMDIGIYEISGKKYTIIHRNDIRLGVKKDNFDLTIKESKLNV